jgi:hypothetical protein
LVPFIWTTLQSWFLSFQQPCRGDGFRGRIATLLAGSSTLSLFWGP